MDPPKAKWPAGSSRRFRARVESSRGECADGSEAGDSGAGPGLRAARRGGGQFFLGGWVGGFALGALAHPVWGEGSPKKDGRKRIHVTQGLVHVSTYQGKPFWNLGFLSHSH